MAELIDKNNDRFDDYIDKYNDTVTELNDVASISRINSDAGSIIVGSGQTNLGIKITSPSVNLSTSVTGTDLNIDMVPSPTFTSITSDSQELITLVVNNEAALDVPNALLFSDTFLNSEQGPGDTVKPYPVRLETEISGATANVGQTFEGFRNKQIITPLNIGDWGDLKVSANYLSHNSVDGESITLSHNEYEQTGTIDASSIDGTYNRVDLGQTSDVINIRGTYNSIATNSATTSTNIHAEKNVILSNGTSDAVSAQDDLVILSGSSSTTDAYVNKAVINLIPSGEVTGNAYGDYIDIQGDTGSDYNNVFGNMVDFSLTNATVTGDLVGFRADGNTPSGVDVLGFSSKFNVLFERAIRQNVRTSLQTPPLNDTTSEQLFTNNRRVTMYRDTTGGGPSSGTIHYTVLDLITGVQTTSTTAPTP